MTELSGIAACRAALERIKKGKANNPEFNNATLTASIVSQEAGYDSGYLKKKRHPDFIAEINDVRNQLEERQGKISKSEYNRVDKSSKKYKDIADRNKILLDEALTREIYLIRKIRELEVELAEVKIKKLVN